jgi:plasmid stability protein
MANLTVTVDDDILRRARIRALELGTSVNAVLRDYLATYAGESPAAEAMRALTSVARKARSGSGKRGRAWTRDDAHER